MASKDITDLTPIMQQRYFLWARGMTELKIPYMITCVGRIKAEQEALYAQGRRTLIEVNALRSFVGLYLLKFEAENIKVTWTLESKHIFDDKGKAHAWDFAILKGTKPTWDLKISVNADQIPDYLQAGEIAEKYSLRWGGRFKSPDYPHIEELTA
jgi:hypothetical protein